MNKDRNFDDLADRFRRNIYGSLKGEVRLNVIERDFKAHIPEYFQDCSDRSVLDVAAGEARFSSRLAQGGCRLTVNDISEKMLGYARENIEQCLSTAKHNTTCGISDPACFQQDYLNRIHFVHAPLQELSDICVQRDLPLQYDLIICHALMEWMAEPESLPLYLKKMLKPEGYLSLTFYNYDGLAFKNLLRTNFRKFEYDGFKPHKGSLTPIHPQKPQHVRSIFEKNGFEIISRSGIRVFHDYILDPQQRERDADGLLARELEYSQREPFWQMARYIHYLCRYTPDLS